MACALFALSPGMFVVGLCLGSDIDVLYTAEPAMDNTY